MFTKLKKKLKNYLIRRAKNKPLVFLTRWSRAAATLNYKFSKMPVNKFSFDWYERNNDRLCDLAARFTEKRFGRKIK